jgi:hypothetical protein
LIGKCQIAKAKCQNTKGKNANKANQLEQNGIGLIAKKLEGGMGIVELIYSKNVDCLLFHWGMLEYKEIWL